MQSSGAKVGDVSVKKKVAFFVMIVTFPWNVHSGAGCLLISSNNQ